MIDKDLLDHMNQWANNFNEKSRQFDIELAKAAGDCDCYAALCPHDIAKLRVDNERLKKIFIWLREDIANGVRYPAEIRDMVDAYENNSE